MTNMDKLASAVGQYRNAKDDYFSSDVNTIPLDQLETLRRAYDDAAHTVAFHADFFIDEKIAAAAPVAFQIPAPDAAPNLLPAAPYAGLENIPHDELRAMFDQPELPAGGYDTCRDCGEKRALDEFGRCASCAVLKADINHILYRCVEDDPTCPNPGWPNPCPRCGFCRQNPDELIGAPDDPLVGAVTPEQPEQDDAEWTQAATEEEIASQPPNSGPWDWDEDDDDYDSEWYDEDDDGWWLLDDEEPEQEQPITEEDLTRPSTPMTDDDEIPW